MTSRWRPTGGRCAPWTEAGPRTPSTPSPSPATGPASSPCPEAGGRPYALRHGGLTSAHMGAEVLRGPVGGGVTVERRQVGAAVVALLEQEQLRRAARLVDQPLRVQPGDEAVEPAYDGQQRAADQLGAAGQRQLA